MGTYDTGVSAYIIGRATVAAYFPIDHKGNEDVCCEQCRFFMQRSRRCGLTEELVPYPTKGIGRDCPMEFFEE